MSLNTTDAALSPSPRYPDDLPRESPARAVMTVAKLELRQRVRSSRWVIVLVLWTAALGLLTFLIRAAAFSSVMTDDDTMVRESSGRLVFGIVTLLVLSLGALVVPALSSTSINGDRQAGVLASMQTTLLTPWQIALGKLVAAWGVALVFLALATPFMVFAGMQGGTRVRTLAVSWVIIAITLGVLAAIGLGFSSLTARTATSAFLSYFATALLGLGLPLLFLLSIPLVSTTETVTRNMGSVYDESTGVAKECAPVTMQESVAHTERTWWLLATSPYFVLADAAVGKPVEQIDDPLAALQWGLREARLGASADQRDECAPVLAQDPRRDLGATWGFGLAMNLLIGAGMFTVAVRRLRSPVRVLPRGTRVA